MGLNHHYPRVEIIGRTLPISYGKYLGTCFTIDVEDRQYIITARHVVEGVEDVDEIMIGRHDKWVTVTVTAIPCSPKTADIIVLAPSRVLTPTLRVICQPDRYIYGQDVFFLGFPFGFTPSGGTPSLAAPFCKRATISAIVKKNGAEVIVLGGQSNSGFSGAPLFYHENGTRVFGVLTGDTRQLIHEFGLGKDKEPVYESAGFIEGVSIKHALDAIAMRPIGAETK